MAARTEWRDGCLEWIGSLTRNGYGQIYVEGKLQSTHRFAWMMAHGPIPDGLEIDHMCWNRACCNVDHLRLVTHEENSRNRRAARKKV
jgi:hypothetical protein